MILPSVKKKLPESKLFTVRKLTKAGSSRYLNIGTVLPANWVAVKMIVEKLDGDLAILRLERIK